MLQLDLRLTFYETLWDDERQWIEEAQFDYTEKLKNQLINSLIGHIEEWEDETEGKSKRYFSASIALENVVK
jgi:hypothetical protein